MNELLLTDGQRLLRRILECPEDDAVRLIYSDWLEEQGDDWDIDAARYIRWAVAHPKESAVCLCVQSIKVNGRACELCRTHKINMPKKKFGTDSPYVMNRGFVSSVSLTCEAFVGGRCQTCDGTGIGACPDVAEYIEIAGGCPKCHGTGRMEGVARELFSRHPITEVKLVDKRPNDYGPPEDGLRFGWLSEHQHGAGPHGLPRDLLLMMPKSGQQYSGRWNLEADANAALSRACVSYGRNLVGLPMLDS